MTDQSRPKGLRLTAFRLGVLVAAVPTLLLGAWMLVIVQTGFDPKYTVEVLSHGADVTRNGGAKVLVTNGHGTVIAQNCRDGCDDFQFQVRSSDNAYSVEVRDAAGKCMVRDVAAYVTTGTLARWVVAGDDELTIRTSYIDRTDDGTFEESALHTSKGSCSPAAFATTQP